jgi:hypothetical protein
MIAIAVDEQDGRNLRRPWGNGLLCAAAPKPKLLAAKGKAATPLRIDRRDTRILWPPGMFGACGPD